MKKKISKLVMGIIFLSIFLTLACTSNKELPLDLIESIKRCSGGVWGENSKTLYYTADGFLWQHSIENNSKKRISDLEGIRGTPMLSSDYSRIAIVKDEEIWIIRLKDEFVENKIKGDIQSGWDLSADAAEVIFNGDGNIWSEVSKNNHHAYVKKSEEWFGMNELFIDDKLIEKEEGILWIFSPYDSPIEWSRDGERLYFISAKSGWSKIYSVKKNGEDLRKETSGSGDDRDFTILSDGSILFVSNRNLYVEWSLWIKKPNQDAELLFGKDGFVRSVSVSPDEELASFLYSTPTQPFELYALNLNSKNLIKLSNNSTEELKNYAVQPKVISYMSGDHEVQGVFYLPDEGNTEAKIPAIIKLHGGPSVHDGLNWNNTIQFLATRGYAVLTINYTGSVGYGKEFEEKDFYRIGKDDCDDVAAAAKYLKTLKEPEIDKIGVTGSSYGGYLTNLVIGRYPDLFDAAVSWFGISNWNTIFEFENLHPVVRKFFLNRLGSKLQYPDLYFEASPVNYADSINTPLLIMHGDIDNVVPFSQSQEFYNLFNEKEKIVDLIKYEEEGHGWSKKETKIDSYKRMEEWFERYLK
jgi:dipeptidyl aminopeptidase/acylaminoacyl peptidase